MTVHKARSLELFFVNGDPEGMLTATVPFQWSGHVLVSKRTQLSEALQRPEVSRPGVYLLVGENDIGESLLYIGESDDIGNRIRSHDANKLWWTTVVFITSNGEPLNKAHVRYLESRLIDKAKQINKIKLDNGVSPSLTPLSEAAVSHMEDFLDNIYLVLPALRFDFFIESTRKIITIEASPASPIFTLSTPKHGLTAKAIITDGHFVVKEGSLARLNWEGAGSDQTSYGKLHTELVQQGILAIYNDKRVFTKSYAFASPSAAAAVINGRPTNGTTAWKLENSGKTYKEWEQQELAKTQPLKVAV
jgi:hypothetical protein